MSEPTPFDTLEAEYAEKVANLQEMKARGRLTSDWGECSLTNAKLTLQDIQYAKSRWVALEQQDAPIAGQREKPWACWNCNQLNSEWATKCGRCGQPMKQSTLPAGQSDAQQSKESDNGA